LYSRCPPHHLIQWRRLEALGVMPPPPKKNKLVTYLFLNHPNKKVELALLKFTSHNYQKTKNALREIEDAISTAN
ncbi:hypothetical protein PSY31_23770, partial [Shigella flexneri]|nr:hypothetical protein [Shigella flexneri]